MALICGVDNGTWLSLRGRLLTSFLYLIIKPLSLQLLVLNVSEILFVRSDNTRQGPQSNAVAGLPQLPLRPPVSPHPTPPSQAEPDGPSLWSRWQVTALWVGTLPAVLWGQECAGPGSVAQFSDSGAQRSGDVGGRGRKMGGPVFLTDGRQWGEHPDGAEGRGGVGMAHVPKEH